MAAVSLCHTLRSRRLAIQVERQLERLEARRQTSLLLARCHALQAALERSEAANHAARLGQLATPHAAATTATAAAAAAAAATAAAATRQPLSTGRTTGVLAPTSHGGRATYYVDEAGEDAEGALALGGALVVRPWQMASVVLRPTHHPTAQGTARGARVRCTTGRATAPAQAYLLQGRCCPAVMDPRPTTWTRATTTSP